MAGIIERGKIITAILAIDSIPLLTKYIVVIKKIMIITSIGVFNNRKFFVTSPKALTSNVISMNI